jgi:hypothetical protein
VPLRFFGDWDMRLSVRGSDRFAESSGFSRASSSLIDNLFRRPQAMSGLQADLSSLAADMRARHPQFSTTGPSGSRAHATDQTVRDVLQTIVVPQLIARHSPQREVLLPVELRVGALVRQLTAVDSNAVRP